MSSTRSYLAAYIEKNGKQVQKVRTWGEIAKAEKKALLRESTSSGYSNWFYIDNACMNIWWINYDTSDGGSWSSEGAMLTGYKVDLESWLADDISILVNRERLAKMAKNKYAQLK